MNDVNDEDFIPLPEIPYCRKEFTKEEMEYLNRGKDIYEPFELQLK